MIHINDLSLTFCSQTIFDDLSAGIKLNKKIGLVGSNGSGKSTLLRVLSGKQDYDKGTISFPPGTKLAFMPQEITVTSQKPLLDEMILALPDVAAKEQEVRTLEQKIHDKIATSADVERYSTLSHDLIELDAQGIRAEAQHILSGLGFKEEDFTKPVDTFSTGWRMRLVLAKLLLQKGDFYLFDEPTNHLDIFAREWFISFLKKASFGFMIVSHERSLLDELCNTIIEINHGKTTPYTGNFSSYESQKSENEKITQSAYENQQREIAQKKKTIERFRTKATKAKMAQSMIKSLGKMELIQNTQANATMNLRFPIPQRSGRCVLDVKDLAVSFGDKKVFKNVSFDIDRGEKIVVIAANGVGKTTLFNTIMGINKPHAGAITFGHNVESTFFTQDAHASLNMNNTILQEIEQSAPHQTTTFVRTVLGTFLFRGDDVKKKISVLSGGEKNRVRLAKTLLHNANFILLDEPTNHLDLQSKEILAQALKAYEGTLFVVSHDPDFINTFATKILELTPTKIKSYPGNYNDYKYLTEKTIIKQQEAVPKKEHSVSYKVRKQINSLEARIDKIEKKIERLEESLKTLTYGSEEFTQSYSDLQSSEKKHHELFKEWEALSENGS